MDAVVGLSVNMMGDNQARLLQLLHQIWPLLCENQQSALLEWRNRCHFECSAREITNPCIGARLQTAQTIKISSRNMGLVQKPEYLFLVFNLC